MHKQCFRRVDHAKQYEIEGAFRAAEKIDQTGRRNVTTEDFVKQLEAVNWNWSLKHANNGIECYVTTSKISLLKKGKGAPSCSSILTKGFEMGFPSPATDYIEERISLDGLFISHPSSTYFMKAANTYWRAGISQGALLIVDCSATPCDALMVVCKLARDVPY
ncbi:hypothetical protein ACY3NT_003286 [Enterobacter sichuanensis]